MIKDWIESLQGKINSKSGSPDLGELKKNTAKKRTTNSFSKDSDFDAMVAEIIIFFLIYGYILVPCFFLYIGYFLLSISFNPDIGDAQAYLKTNPSIVENIFSEKIDVDALNIELCVQKRKFLGYDKYFLNLENDKIRLKGKGIKNIYLGKVWLLSFWFNGDKDFFFEEHKTLFDNCLPLKLE